MSALVTVQQLACEWNVSERTIRRKCAAGIIPAERAAGCRGGKGGVVYVISPASLSAPDRTDDPGDRPGLPGHTINLTNILAAGGKEALKSAHVRTVVVRKSLAVAGPGKTAQRQAIASEAGISLVTLYRWMEQYQKGGATALVPDKPNDPLAPNMGCRSFEPRALNHGVGLYVALAKTGCRPKIAKIWRDLQAEAKAQGWRLGSRATFYRIIEERFTESERTFLVEGEKAWKGKHMPKARRDYNSLLPNQFWVGDHYEFPVFVNHGGKAVKPWLTSWQDMRSRKSVGWAISVKPNSESIALALRHGIMGHGIPANVYIDNGKDYLSKRLNAGLDGRRDYSREMSGIFANLGVEVTNSIPYHAWSKPIERTHRTITDQFARYLPGWCGQRPTERPQGFNEKKLLEEGKLLTMDEFIRQFTAFWEMYNNQQHSGQGMNGRTPAQVWADLPKAREDRVTERALDHLLMKAEEALVYGDVIKRFNHEYQHDDLARFAGMKLTIRFDPNRIGELHVFYKNKYVCTATNRQLLKMGAAEADTREHLARQRREVKRIKEKIEAESLGRAVADRKIQGPRAVAGPTPDPTQAPKIVSMTGFENVPVASEPEESALLPRQSSLGSRLLREQGLKALGIK